MLYFPKGTETKVIYFLAELKQHKHLSSCYKQGRWSVSCYTFISTSPAGSQGLRPTAHTEVPKQSTLTFQHHTNYNCFDTNNTITAIALPQQSFLTNQYHRFLNENIAFVKTQTDKLKCIEMVLNLTAKCVIYFQHAAAQTSAARCISERGSYTLHHTLKTQETH